MQAILFEEFGAWPASVIKHRLDNVDIVEPGILCTESSNQLIGLGLLVKEGPTCRAWLDPDNVDARPGQLLMDEAGQLLKLAAQLFRRDAVGEIIIASIEDDAFRGVFENDAIGIVQAVTQVRTAETAIDNRQVGERSLDFPQADAGTANEQDALARRHALLVASFKLGNLLLPNPGIPGLLLLGRGGDRPEKEAQRE